MRCAALLTAAMLVLAPGCRKKIEGPEPSPVEVSPQVLCGAQFATEMTLSGSGFSPLPLDALTGSPRLALPLISLTRQQDLDGGSASDAPWVLNPDPTDTSNLRVRWDSLEQMAWTLDPTDTALFTGGVLPEGVYAVTVKNDNGGEKTLAEAFTAVPPPVATSVAPTPICAAQYVNEITITGTGFLKVGSALPTVILGNIQLGATGVDDCTSLLGPRTDVQRCTIVTAEVPAGALAAGEHAVVVRNPFPAACASTEALTLHVLPPPTVADVVPDPVCLDQGEVSVTITGTGFLGIGTDVPAVTVGAASASGIALATASCTDVANLTGVQTCTEMTAVLAQDLVDGGATYDFVVTNPESAQCSSEEDSTLTVVPPPNVTSISPDHICAGGSIFTVVGTDLWAVDAQLVRSDGQVTLLSANVEVNEAATQAQISFGEGVGEGTYELRMISRGGCSHALTDAVTATLGPSIYFLDPPVVYNAVPIRATLYVSDLDEAPAAGNVELVSQDGTFSEAVTNITWNSAKANVVQFTIPSELPVGVYDLRVRNVGGCDMVKDELLTVVSETKLALLDPPLDPEFGDASVSVAVNVLAKADADLDVAAGEVSFEAVPRVYLFDPSTPLAAAAPIAATFNDSTRLTGIVPVLAAGTYDLIVVNPKGTDGTAAVGYYEAAYRALAVPPPLVDDVSPAKILKEPGQQVTITGSNFLGISEVPGDGAVSVPCADGSTATITSIDASAAASGTLEVMIDAGAVGTGTTCVVRVTNVDQQTWDEWSALAVTNPAGNLSAFIGPPPDPDNPPAQYTHDMAEGRRAPGLVVGSATREARFLYAIGGDDGDPVNAKVTVEASTLGRFGEIGPWSTLQTTLPAGRTLAHARRAGRFIYLLGGMVIDSGTSLPVVTAEILRAEILDPLGAPDVTDVSIQIAETGNGLVRGVWAYAVSAILADADTGTADAANPGGETLPSVPAILYTPLVLGGDGQEERGVWIDLSWPTVYGSDGITPAVKYRVYRTPTVDGTVDDLRLLAEVDGTTAAEHSYLDQNPATFLDDSKEPLAVGALGEWHAASVSLTAKRAAYGFTDVVETGCPRFWYLFGGHVEALDGSTSATESSSYEVAEVTDDGSGNVTLGSFVQFTATAAAGSSIDARRELAIWHANGENTDATLATCEHYLYVGPGDSGDVGSPTAVDGSRVAKRSSTTDPGHEGQVGEFSDATKNVVKDLIGYAAFMSGDRAYVLGGLDFAGGSPTEVARDANWSASDGQPYLSNFSAGGVLVRARYYPGYTRSGSFNYFVGGIGAGSVLEATTEYNVQ